MVRHPKKGKVSSQAEYMRKKLKIHLVSFKILKKHLLFQKQVLLKVKKVKVVIHLQLSLMNHNGIQFSIKMIKTFNIPLSSIKKIVKIIVYKVKRK